MGKRAVVIENDATIREYIEVMFEVAGIDVVSAQDGQSGLELSRRYKPDLIVSDLYMAGISGIDLFERLRADTGTDHIPFMFITADARESVRRYCLDLGADAFLLKPFTFDQFMDAARALLGGVDEEV